MRAVAVKELGAGPEVTDVVRPEPVGNEVLVRVEAAGLNPLDWRIADGMLKGTRAYTFPMTMGVDFAGYVEDTGPDARRFRIGDPVYGQVVDPGRGGTYAEYVVVPDDGAIAPSPSSVPHDVSAGVPTAGMTARGIVGAAALREYESVLVVGAAGGVGTFLTQLAAAHGLRVVAATHGNDQRRMGTFGAALTVNSREHPLTERVRDEYPGGVDALVDLASGPEEFAAHARLVRNGGVAVSTRFAADPEALYAAGVEGINFSLDASAELLDALAREIDSGALIVPVEARVPLDEAPDAVARNRSGGARGKTVITL
ncbi:NADP-dependent oxidoreductase [Streptomyces sp. NPDC048172]|uniref:NADP-dependent oxidoreductase n=1 Tax=Streptomyces sp. NPDC048172 TaxID=3365505 RepID=UPI00371F2CB8